MPVLELTLLDKYCPTCLKKNRFLNLVQVRQEWQVDDEDGSNVEPRSKVLEQCPCGYAKTIFDELPLVKEPSVQELAALRGTKVAEYRFASDFKNIHRYFLTRKCPPIKSRNMSQKVSRD